ncbi:PH domain-like [Trinorchestia longiramus]|nr:PH domain-like [Trinorchestia longiramus]
MENTPKKPTLHRRKKNQPKAPAPAQHGSESDGSADSNSMSGDSQHAPESSERHHPVTKKGEWEILSGLKQGQRFEFSPGKFEGYLHKRRKWPLKGWHKRYFVLDNSILTYAKNASELARGKKHGSMDIGLSVISTKASRRRIDIDADASIIHIRCESQENYLQWVEQLKQHRLRKQHQMLYTEHVSPAAGAGPLLSPASPSDDSPTG